MDASTKKSNDDSMNSKTIYQISSQHSSGMTPSIITTINNTSPTLPISSSINTNNNGGPGTRVNKRNTEPYESYIEDSFVGHWEREDDDLNGIYDSQNLGENNNGEDDDSALHPSTIEFDFDSFGPESFIYTPGPSREPLKTQNLESPEKKVEEEICEPVTTQSQPVLPQHVTMNLDSADYLIDGTQIDLKVIEPYKKVISHAGYCHHLDPSVPASKPGEPAPAIIVFSACYLPDRSRRDYNYVMDHLFLYVLSSLHELIADDYILIYLHNTQPFASGGTSSKGSSPTNLTNGSLSSTTLEDPQQQNNLPTFTWVKRCYQMIDRKLRKNLKILYLVKPTFWLKTIVIMCKPFISTKFSKKLRFVESMDALKKCIPVEELTLPPSAANI